MTFRHVDFRLLKKLNLLNYLNVARSISFSGHKLAIPVINSLGYPNLFLKPNWLYSIINELFDTDNEGFVDVGANIGQTLIAVKTAKHQIHYVGFEPSISCCYYLKKLIRINGFADCQIYNFALSDELKETYLETNGEADPTGSIVSALRPSFFKQRESIFSIDHDRLHLDQKITCVKIDVEGGELETLLGMQNLIRRDRPYILCEILDSFSDDVLAFTQERADRVCDTLKKHDYSIIQIVQNEATGQIISFNEIDGINICQWRKESLQLNDYIFYPVEKRKGVIEILARLSH
ncbi:FkbM family methyltransferase [Spirosoma aureum]|uniref:FkbM family methyltransferase n=1 Tax=Spirosoma aureum TaxID=2692134 RepID=A0A6G9ANP8_9BACT|nr:FkbM family methyltransferase [Spirosoma aureum]QIP13905.1 FkbM family methyltransferase [Spirosoma aureum]